MNLIDTAVVAVIICFVAVLLYLFFGKERCPKCNHPKFLHSTLPEGGTTPNSHICRVCGEECLW